MASALADRPLQGFRLAEGKKEAGLKVRGIMLSINTQRSGIDPDALVVPPLMAALSAMMATPGIPMPVASPKGPLCQKSCHPC